MRSSQSRRPEYIAANAGICEEVNERSDFDTQHCKRQIMIVRVESTVRRREGLSHTVFDRKRQRFSVISLEQAIARAAVDLREKLDYPLKP